MADEERSIQVKFGMIAVFDSYYFRRSSAKRCRNRASPPISQLSPSLGQSAPAQPWKSNYGERTGRDWATMEQL